MTLPDCGIFNICLREYADAKKSRFGTLRTWWNGLRGSLSVFLRRKQKGISLPAKSWRRQYDSQSQKLEGHEAATGSKNSLGGSRNSTRVSRDVILLN